MSFRRRLSVIPRLTTAVVGCMASSAVFALTFNPIDPSSSLPLSIHARASCMQGTVSYPGNLGNTTLQVSDQLFSAACSGNVSQENPATLTQVFGSDSASANLASGTLRTVAIGRSLADTMQALRAGASSNAYLYDTLTVNGTWSGIKLVELRLAVDGSLTSNTLTPNWQSSNVSSTLLILSKTGTLLGNAGLLITQGNDGRPFITSSAENVVSLGTNATNTVFDPANVRFDYSFVFPATTSNRTFTFASRLSVSSAMGFAAGANGAAEGVIDFGNTAQFSLIVPDGVTVTSASGQFLTAVPEPSVFWLLPTGVAVVCGRVALRRRC